MGQQVAKFPKTFKELQQAPYIDPEITIEAESPRCYLVYIQLDWIPPICHKNLTSIYGSAKELLSQLKVEFWHVLRNPQTGEFLSRTPDYEAWEIIK